MTKTDLVPIKAAILEALKPLEARFKVSIQILGGSFTDTTYCPKLTLVEDDKDGNKVDPKVDDFRKHAHYYGLKSEDLGRKLTCGFKTYTLVGFKASARSKSNFLLERDGKVYRTDIDQLRRGLGMKPVLPGMPENQT